MDSMIKVEDVSMKFNLGIEKNFSLKLFFINMFKPKKKDEKKGNKDFWALKHGPSTSPPLIWSCETWMRWMDVSLPRISSCSAFCMLGYPS